MGIDSIVVFVDKFSGVSMCDSISRVLKVDPIHNLKWFVIDVRKYARMNGLLIQFNFASQQTIRVVSPKLKENKIVCTANTL